MTDDTWCDCYSGSWRGLICPDAFAHPAKFARTLIQRIYEHALEEGWLKAGETCLDPFGGVSLGALDAGLRGIQHIAVELEPRFHAQAQANIALWHQRYGLLPQWVRPVTLQGDSRQLHTVLSEQAGMALGSPPYANGCTHTGGVDSQPQYIQGGALQHVTYGQSDGQLGAMSSGQLDTVFASPPYEASWHRADTTEISEARMRKAGYSDQYIAQQFRASKAAGGNLNAQAYGTEPGQLGSTQGQTFWEAAQTIVAQVYACLRHGGSAIWVCKDYVRANQRVPFSANWVRLCENVGFQLVHWHRALLVEDYGAQETFNEGTAQITVERKAFFRRLCETKGSPRIDWEDVLCMQKGRA